MNWPEEIYSFTKPGKSIVTWKFVIKTEDGRAEYYSNYHQRKWISQMELDNYYFTSLESCYESWIDSIEKFKQKVIKQFENKCGVNYFNIAFSKIVENHNKRRQDEVAKSEVEPFVLDHFAQYSEIVHRECLESNIMTWRKLREQLDNIPEHQLDLPVKTLDNDDFWFDTIEIKIADEPLYKELSTGENVPVSKSSHLEESEMILQVFEEEPYLHTSL